MSRYWYLIFCITPVLLFAGHKRDGADLPDKEKEFAQQLSVQKRRIYCGRFNQIQRLESIKYARGRGLDTCFTPDEAVTKVMEDSGMSLAIKRRED